MDVRILLISKWEKSADHQSEQSAKYEETRPSHLQDTRHKHLEENHSAKYKETCPVTLITEFKENLTQQCRKKTLIAKKS